MSEIKLASPPPTNEVPLAYLDSVYISATFISVNDLFFSKLPRPRSSSWFDEDVLMFD